MAAWRLAVTATPPLLFRFSALTANAHRIHYDQPYCTDVERYPGLVVHGPLLAVLMAELPRRHALGRRITGADLPPAPSRLRGRADASSPAHRSRGS